MKANSNIMQVFSKGLLLSSVLFCSLHGVAQSNRAIWTDTKLGNIVLTDLNGNNVDEAYVPTDEMIKLKIPFNNYNHGQDLPAGSCKLKIGLGSKMHLDASQDLNLASLNSYFKWTVSPNSGQDQSNR